MIEFSGPTADPQTAAAHLRSGPDIYISGDAGPRGCSR